jgi:hypothetical protein
MLHVARKACGIGVVAFGLLIAGSIVGAGPASAQMREFTGKVDTITNKKIIIDNRQGDKVSFERVDGTVVEGEKKTWDEIKKNDWATVSWKFIDKPRKAYKVTVIPPKEEAGEEVK